MFTSSVNHKKFSWLNSVFTRGLILTVLGVSITAQAASIDIKLTNVTSDAGNIRLAIYDSPEGFNTQPFRAVSMPAQKGDMRINLSDLPAGEYAIMLFQDIDSNEKLDTNLFGIPREPWGGSLGGKPVFSAPDWESTCFVVPETGTQISIALR